MLVVVVAATLVYVCLFTCMFMETKNNDALEDFNKKAREELNEGYKLIVNHIDSVNDYLKKSSVEFPNCDNVNFNDYFFGTTTYMAGDCTISNLKSNETS